MPVDEALAYALDLGWRTFLARGDRAVIALPAQVERLRGMVDIVPEATAPVHSEQTEAQEVIR